MRDSDSANSPLLVVAVLGALVLQFWILDRPLPQSVGLDGQRAEIMGYRHQVLVDTTAAYEETGHVLLAHHAGRGYGPLDSTDDVGAFVLVPVLTRALDLPLDVAIEIFYTSAIVVGVVIGLVGWFCLCQTMASRLVAAAFVGHFAVVLSSQTDVYVVSAAACLAAPPWILWWARRDRFDPLLMVAVVLGALLMATSQVVRSHAATGLVLFGAVVFGTSRAFTLRQKAAITVAFTVSWCVPRVVLSHLQETRDEYLIGESGWSVAELENIEHRHPFWHSVYIGLGYLPNDYGISYDDMCAYAHAKRIAGDDVAYTGAEYEAALRSEYLRIAGTDPGFVFSVVIAKLVVVGKLVFKFANVGLLLVLLAPGRRRENIGFLLAIAFSSLFGLLVMPVLSYMLGLCALAAGFGAHVLTTLLDQRVPQTGTIDLPIGRRRARCYRLARVALASIVAVVGVGETQSVASSIRNRIHGARRDAARDELAARLASDAAVAALPVRASFRPELWEAANQNVGIEWQRMATMVNMDDTPSGYQLVGPTLETEPGTQLVVRGEFEVLSGAVVVGALNDQGLWMWQRTFAVGEHAMLDVLVAERTRSIQFLVANAGSAESPSVRIRRIDVLDATEVNRPDDAPTLSPAAERDVRLERVRLKLDAGDPSSFQVRARLDDKEWSTAAEGVRLNWRDGIAQLVTNTNPSGYQLWGPMVNTTGDDSLVFDVDVEVFEGGVVVGLLDDRQRWLFQRHYETESNMAAAIVDVSGTESVRPVVTNIGSTSRSRVEIHRADLRALRSEP